MCLAGIQHTIFRLLVFFGKLLVMHILWGENSARTYKHCVAIVASSSYSENLTIPQETQVPLKYRQLLAFVITIIPTCYSLQKGHQKGHFQIQLHIRLKNGMTTKSPSLASTIMHACISQLTVAHEHNEDPDPGAAPVSLHVQDASQLQHHGEGAVKVLIEAHLQGPDVDK